MSVPFSVLFRCDGTPQIGLGHVVRCLALAEEFRGRGCLAAFAMREGPIGFAMVKKAGYDVLTPNSSVQSFDYQPWLAGAARRVDANAIVADVRDESTRDQLDAVRKKGVLVAVIDDGSDRRLAADLVFCPPVPQVQELDWTGFRGELYVGWDWVVLRRAFSRPPARQAGARPMVLVTMGATDPAGLTVKVLEALRHVEQEFEVAVAIGPGFVHREELDQFSANARRCFRIYDDVPGMAAVMAQADLAVASFGMTAYELAAMGVPAIHLALTEDHARSASAFEQAGMAFSLGVHSPLGTGHIAASVERLLKDAALRERMAARCRSRVDGKGAVRIADKVVQHLEL